MNRVTPRPRLLKGFFAFLTALAWLCALLPVPERAEAGRQFNLLYLNSYHRGYYWSDGIEQGLRDSLAASGQNIGVYSEYLDTRRFPDKWHLPSTARALADKYTEFSYDLVVTSDNNALDFALHYRERLFPDVPIVFCGYNHFTRERLRGVENVTGIVEALDFRATLDLALNLHPATQTLIFVVSDFSTSTASNLRHLETVLPEYRERYEIVLLKNLPVRELERRLAESGPRAVGVIFGRAVDSREGGFFSVEEFARRLAEASRVPLYSMWDFHLNTGVMGGHILTGEAQGRTSAELLVLPILAGTPVDSLPVITHTPGVTRLDYRAMQRFGVSEAAVPPGSQIINKPPGLYQTHREAVWTVVGVFLLLLLTLVILVEILRRLYRQKTIIHRHQLELEQRVAERTRHLDEARRRAKADSDKLESLLSRINGISWEVDLGSSKFTYVSPNAERILGYPAETWVDMDTWAARVLPEDRSRAVEYCRTETSEGRDHVFEYRVRKPNGEVAWVMDVVSVVKDQDTGRPVKLTGFMLDDSVRHLMEQQLAESNALWQALLMQAPIPIAVAQKTGELTFNPACQKFLGMGDEIQPGDNFFEIPMSWQNYDAEGNRVPPEQIPLARALRGEVVMDMEMRVLRRDGGEAWAVVSAAPIYNQVGDILAGLVVFPEITARKQAEETNARLLTILESATDLISMADNTGRPIYMNRAGMKMLGFGPGETLDYHHSCELHPPESVDFFRETVFPALERDGVWRGESEFLARDGQRILTSQVLLCHRDTAGEIEFYSTIARDIREQKQTETLYRTLFEQSPDAVTVMEPESLRMLIFNDRLCEILGYSREELAESTIAEYEALLTPEQIRQRVKMAREAGHAEFETGVRTREGTVREVAVSIRVINLFGNILFHNVIRDVTEHNLAQQALKESRRDLQIIFDSVHAMIWHLDRDHRVRRVNHQAARHSKLAPEQVVGKTAWELFPPEFAEIYQADNVKVMRSGRSKLGIIEPGPYPDGGTGWFQTDKVPYFDEQGQVAGVTIFVTDITQIKRVEAALRDSEALYQSLVDSLPMNVYRIDREGRLTFVNQALLENLGMPAEAVLGKTAYNFYPPELADKYRRDDVGVLAGGQILHITEENLNPKTGEQIQVEVVKIPVYGEQEQIIGIQGVFWDVSERIRAEGERELLLYNLKEAQRIARLGNFIWNIQTDEVTWSEGMYYLLKYDIGEFLDYAKVNTAIHHPEDLERVTRWLRESMAAGVEILTPNEYRLLCKDGEVIQVQTNGRIEYRDGKPIQLLGTCLDITERKRAEQELQQSEARFRHFFEKNSSVMLLIDPENGKIMNANDAAARFYGHSLRQLLTLSIQDINILSEEAIARERRHAQREERNYFHFQHRLGNGEIRDVEVYSTPILMDERTLLFSIVHDITQRRRAEAALRASERKYRSLLETTPEGFWVIDREHQAVEVNDSLCAMLGYAREEILGKTPFDFVPAEQHPVLSKQLATIPLTTHRNFELIFQRKGGEALPTLITATTLSDEADHILGGFAFITDITELKHYEAELVDAREAAEAASRAKSSFLANMSHELRTPLNAVMGYAQMLAKAEDLSPEYQHMAETINRSGEHLLTLLNDVLDLSKIEAGRFDLHPRRRDLRHFLRALGEIFRVRAAQKNLEFYQRINENVPAEVEMDDIRVRQILLNLLGNAVKFTERGYVGLYCDHADGRVCFSVRDSGPGISPTQWESIFQPFQQAGDERYKAQGTGLGLAICRKLTELMDGSLEVESEPGQGSTFHLRLPVTVLSHNESGVEKPSPEGKVTGYTRLDGKAPFRVLVVDDIAENREFLYQLLQSVGFHPRQADSGEACLRVLRDWLADLVLMDLKMPGLDGLETTRALRAGELNFPIIAVSAGAFQEDRDAALAAGCTDYVVKPVHEAELFACLGRHLALEWQHQASVCPVSEEPTPPLSPKHRRELLALLKMGDVNKLLAYLETLRSRQDTAEAGTALLKLAQGFKLRELKQRLEMPEKG